ncbi:twin-arginine translocase TatA/TatE family subunit [Azospirillum cavernae]|uniref:Sec-independent protein translocase protein TatA n=1 Tax=Azospirillum cavernae TaxID=2320860 RepID=A0A418W314_9PROT|nr:twin-arginine translocase TatA/TatE family subunit [Azospirillum cavernae]RJF84386.1 twin-arginine translocase TatA/TatE family subunit [Azospirillum cavernae]
MGSFSIWHWIIVLLIVLLLFGAGKLPAVMGDIAKGVKAFKAGLKDGEEDTAAAPPATTAQTAAQTAAPAQTAAQAPAQPQAQPQPVAAPTEPAKPHQG